MSQSPGCSSQVPELNSPEQPTSMSPKNPQLTFRQLGEGWKGYKVVRNSAGTVDGGICLDCGKYYKRPEQKRLLNHKKNCTKKKPEGSNVQSSSECDNGSVLTDRTNSTAHEVSNRTSLVKFPKKRSSSEMKMSGKSAPECSVHILLAKLMLRFNIPFSNLTSIHLSNFVENLDPEYEIPCQNDFEEKIIPRTVADIIKNNVSCGITKIMIVQSIESNGKDAVVSVILTDDKKQILVDVKILDNVTEEAVYNFCESSANSAFKLYKVYPAYILHNTCYNFEISANEAGDKATYYVKSFTMVLDDLRFRHDPFVIGHSNQDLLQKYYEAIDNVRDTIMENNSVDVATWSVLGLAEDPNFSSNGSVEFMIDTFLSPIHIAGMFFNPEYHMRSVNHERRTKMMTFVNSVMRKNFKKMSWLGYYMNKTEDFLDFFEDYENDREGFWGIAAASYPDLSEFAMTLLNLPAITRISHIEEICQEFISFTDESDELKALKLAILLEDCSG